MRAIVMYLAVALSIASAAAAEPGPSPEDAHHCTDTEHTLGPISLNDRPAITPDVQLAPLEITLIVKGLGFYVRAAANVNCMGLPP